MPLASTGAKVSPKAPMGVGNRNRYRDHRCCRDRKDCRNRNQNRSRIRNLGRNRIQNLHQSRSQNLHQSQSQNLDQSRSLHRNQNRSRHRSHCHCHWDCSRSVRPVRSSCSHRRSGHCRAVDHPDRHSDSAAGTGSDSCCPTDCWDPRWDACRQEQWAVAWRERERSKRAGYSKLHIGAK